MADGTKIDELTELDCAYLAGLIDGEGSIYVMKHKEKTYYPAISIMMTHQPVMTWVAGKLGLLVADVPRKPKNWRHSVRLHGKRAVALCRRMLPYLIVKRKQAELVQEFPFEQRAGKPRNGRELEPWVVQKRAKLRDDVNALNKRGTAA